MNNFSNGGLFPRPRKSLGQHFLIDTFVIQQIVAAIHPQVSERIIEIGAGRGALTLALLARMSEIEVIEFDRDLAKWLRQQAGVTVYEADVLTVDFAAIFAKKADFVGKMRIVGNLPYNISTPLLFYLMGFKAFVADLTFMLQKEVVDRLVALPDSGEYGRLSVMVQYAYAVERLFDVSPDAFEPPPKVDSSVVRLVPYPQPPVVVADEVVFAQLVGRAFSQRRKTLRNTLKGCLSPAQMEAVGVDPQARAETLSLQAFAALANVWAGDGCGFPP